MTYISDTRYSGWQMGLTYNDPDSTDNNISQSGKQERQPATLHGGGADDNLSSTVIPDGQGLVLNSSYSYTLYHNMKHVKLGDHLFNFSGAVQANGRYDASNKTQQFGGASGNAAVYYSSPKSDEIEFLGWHLGNFYGQANVALNGSYCYGDKSNPSSYTGRITLDSAGIYFDNADPLFGLFGLTRLIGSDMKADYYAKVYMNYNINGVLDSNISTFAPDLMSNKLTIWGQLGTRIHFTSDSNYLAQFDVTTGETTPGRNTTVGELSIINKGGGWDVKGSVRTPDIGDTKPRLGFEFGKTIINKPKWWKDGTVSMFIRGDHIEDARKQGFMPGIMVSTNDWNFYASWIFKPKEDVTAQPSGNLNVFDKTITGYGIDSSAGIYQTAQEFAGTSSVFKINNKNYAQFILSSTGASIYTPDGELVATIPVYLKEIKIKDVGGTGLNYNQDISSYFSSYIGSNGWNFANGSLTVNLPDPTSYGNTSGNVKIEVDYVKYGSSASDWDTYWNNGYHYTIQSNADVYRGVR